VDSSKTSREAHLSRSDHIGPPWATTVGHAASRGARLNPRSSTVSDPRGVSKLAAIATELVRNVIAARRRTRVEFMHRSMCDATPRGKGTKIASVWMALAVCARLFQARPVARFDAHALVHTEPGVFPGADVLDHLRCDLAARQLQVLDADEAGGLHRKQNV
jgi:hypothetical protein